MNVFDKITVTDIKQMFTVMSPRGRTVIITGRKYYGLSFCIDGKITYTIGGKQVVSDINHAVILPKGKSYSLHGALKVGAVAEQCGFTNQYHFCRIFKEKTGLTPTEFAKHNRIYKI